MTTETRKLFSELNDLLNPEFPDMELVGEKIQELEEAFEELEDDVESAREDAATHESESKGHQEELEEAEHALENVTIDDASAPTLDGKFKLQALRNMMRNLTLTEVEAAEQAGKDLCEKAGRTYLTYGHE